MMGMGYPGGAEIDRLAREGDPEAFDFPVGMRRAESLDFSFSGLKTALVYKVRDLGPEQALARRADLAASFQRAVVESLLLKLEQALDPYRASRGWRSGAGWRPTRSSGPVLRRCASARGSS